MLGILTNIEKLKLCLNPISSLKEPYKVKVFMKLCGSKLLNK